MATPSSVLAWRIPWMEKPGRLQSMGSHRVGHDWSDLAASMEVGYCWYWLAMYYNQEQDLWDSLGLSLGLLALQPPKWQLQCQGSPAFKMVRKDEADTYCQPCQSSSIKKVRAFPEATSSQTSTGSHWPELGHMTMCCESGKLGTKFMVNWLRLVFVKLQQALESPGGLKIPLIATPHPSPTPPRFWFSQPRLEPEDFII